jgi:hypothetical protein
MTDAEEVLSIRRASATYGPAMMSLARSARGRTRRPMLLALVFGFVLVLVGVTASALAAVASDHLASSTLGGVVKRDASLVELFVNGNLRAADLDADGPSPARVIELSGLLAGLTGNDEILRMEIRGLDGRVLASDAAAAVGQLAPTSAAMAAALDGDPSATVVVAVSDAFSAMTTTRPYRKALPVEEALKRLGDAAGTQLQEDLVIAFITGIETAADAPLPGEESPRIWTPQTKVA